MIRVRVNSLFSGCFRGSSVAPRKTIEVKTNHKMLKLPFNRPPGRARTRERVVSTWHDVTRACMLGSAVLGMGEPR